MEVSREKGPGEFRRERQQTQNELFLFLCPRKNMKEHLLKLTMCLAPCCDSLTESALQMYYYLHLMDEETVVYRLHTPPSSGPSDRAGFEPRSSSRRRYIHYGRSTWIISETHGQLGLMGYVHSPHCPASTSSLPAFPT